MQEVEVTFGRAAQVWWAWLWRVTIYNSLLGLLIEFDISLAGHVAHLPSQYIILVNMLLGAGIGVIISIWIMTKILKKKFGSFRIVLVQSSDFTAHPSNVEP